MEKWRSGKSTLCMPADMAAGMKHPAQENDHSLNRVIVQALREYLSRQTGQAQRKQAT